MKAVNLIPADQRSGASVGAGRSGGGAYAVLAALTGIAVLAVLYGMANHQIAKREAQAAEVAAKVLRAEAQTTQLAPYTSFLATREQRMLAVSTLLNTRFDWAHAFHELGRVLPANISISSLDGTVAGASSTAPAPAPAAPPAATSATSASAAGAAAAASAPAAASATSVTSATPPGSVPAFTLAGCATSQPAVATMLERLRLIDGVNDVTLQSSTASAASAGAGGGCPKGGPAFTVQITFAGLPIPSAGSSASSTVAASGSTGSSATTAGGSN